MATMHRHRASSCLFLLGSLACVAAVDPEQPPCAGDFCEGDSTSFVQVHQAIGREEGSTESDFTPTWGEGGMLPVTLGQGLESGSHERPADVCDRDHYVPSVLEAGFRKNVLAWTVDEETLCSHLGEKERWISQVQAKEAPGPLFSRLCRRGRVPQLIEPLAGILRDPRFLCPRKVYGSSIEWLVLGDASLLEQGGKKILFDAGGTRFMDAMNFFSSHYKNRGITFDHIYVWEARAQPDGAYWEGTPKEIRQFWEPRLTFNNGVPVQAEVGHVDNPVDQIYKLCRPQDFCSFKLDIDTPSVELPLVQQLLSTPEQTGALLDEFFFEHHVRGLMENYGWGHGSVNGTFADSYDIFTRLRSMGVRAHSWI